MGCKSILYGANQATQTVAVNGVINFGSVVRKYGCNAYMSGGNAVITGVGYYDIDTNFRLVATAATASTITLYKDGVAIPGAIATVNPAAIGDVVSVSIPAVVKNLCGCEQTITAVLTGSGANLSDAAIVVRKV